MNAKFFLPILLSTLFAMPISAQYQKDRYREHTRFEKNTHYNLNRFDIRAEEINGNLTIAFQGYLEEAEIVITDKEGNVILQQNALDIIDGMTLQLPPSPAYPHYITINSPTLEVTGEITAEKL